MLIFFSVSIVTRNYGKLFGYIETEKVWNGVWSNKFPNEIQQVIKGRRRITSDKALRLSKYFGTSPKFWLGLQDDYNIEEEQLHRKTELDNIKPIESNAA